MSDKSISNRVKNNSIKRGKKLNEIIKNDKGISFSILLF